MAIVGYNSFCTTFIFYANSTQVYKHLTRALSGASVTLRSTDASHARRYMKNKEQT
jgi:hypothetical protein